MPDSAIASGAVDFVLSPKQIALQLSKLAKTGLSNHTIKNKPSPLNTEEIINDTNPDLKLILKTLHKEINVDFSLYKMATVKRRIIHRMMQCGVKTIKEYAKKLIEKNSNEVNFLYKDLLINITNFFRDTDTFNYLKNTLLPNLLKLKKNDDALRIWIPACSTGEEAYTIAMLLTELQSEKTNKVAIQIFATDLSEHAITDARIGEYSEDNLKPVGKKRIDRFFTKSGKYYRIVKEIRDMCVFATHNILRDPPFSRIDFVSCRNLLIYFDIAAQKKALTTMNFALNDGGYLMLGKSETVGISSQLFTQFSAKFKIYTRKNNGIRRIPELSPRFSEKTPSEKSIQPVPKKTTVPISTDLDQAIDATLLSIYMPSSVIINKGMDILKFRGDTSLYLSHQPGTASLNILKMTRPEFVFELRNAIHETIKTKKPVFKTGIELNPDINDIVTKVISIEVRPLIIEWGEALYIVVFRLQETEPVKQSVLKKTASAQNNQREKNQIAELHRANTEMITLIESQDRAYEELQAANEEVISVSEEFQTLNEELETSKEEIEATNEELLTTNQELQMRNEQLAESYNFSEAVAETMHEPMIILDKQLRIKSANKAFYQKFRVMERGTKGMLLYELGNHQWDIPSLRQLLENINQKNTHFYDHEVTYTFPEIGKKTMLLNARRIIQKTQNEQLILLTFTDTTELIKKQKVDTKGLENIIKERTEALEQSYKTVVEKNLFLEKANNQLETFNFISSHDLQEPLRKIRMFTSVLLEDETKRLSVQGKETLKRIQTTGNRMHQLINDLLLYAKIKDGDKKIQKADLNKVTLEIIDEFKEALTEKKGKIECEGVCDANIISFQFRQLIHNLISNSLKFSHAERFPRISIKSKTTPGRLLKFGNLLPEVNYCHICYTDNGIGFDPKYKEKIFEVFQRLHGQDKYKGTGIGLAICKRIIENHKGIITATGRLNKGAQFDIYIPAC